MEQIQLDEHDQRIIREICRGVVVTAQDDAEAETKKRNVVDAYAAAFLAAKRFALSQSQGASIPAGTILELAISWVGIFLPLTTVGDYHWRPQQSVADDLQTWSSDLSSAMDADWGYWRLRRMSSLVDGNKRLAVLWWMVLASISSGRWPTSLPDFERLDRGFDQLRTQRTATC